MLRVTIAAAVVILFSSAPAIAGPTEAQKCEAGKNQVAGKYASCMHKAQSKFIKGGGTDTASYDAAVLKCDGKYGTKWQKLEEKAAGACPSTGDEAEVQDFVDACVVSVEGALGGTALSQDVVSCNSDLTTCQGDLGSCQSDLSATNADLGTCNGNLATCSSDLSTTNADLTTCEGDLSTTNADLTTCEGDLSTTNADLTTCEGDLSTTNADLTSCEGDLSTTNADLTTCEGDLSTTNADLTTCEADLATCQGGGSSGGLPASGQTTAYGTGSDGDVQSGAALSYQDNGDGTITDLNTGLMWEKKIKLDGTQVTCSATEAGSCADPHDADNYYNWSASSPNFNGGVSTIFLTQLNDRCNNDTTVSCTVDADCSVPGGACGFAGHRDWRLPSMRELLSILHYENTNPAVATAFHGASCGPSCTDLTDPACSCTRSYFHWSSTTYQLSTSNAWIVAFNGGDTGAGNKTGTVVARAVRGGS